MVGVLLIVTEAGSAVDVELLGREVSCRTGSDELCVQELVAVCLSLLNKWWLTSVCCTVFSNTIV
jgi:hypothetical protein